MHGLFSTLMFRNFGVTTTNRERVVPRKTVFAMLYVCKTETTHAGVTSSKNVALDQFSEVLSGPSLGLTKRKLYK